MFGYIFPITVPVISLLANVGYLKAGSGWGLHAKTTGCRDNFAKPCPALAIFCQGGAKRANADLWRLSVTTKQPLAAPEKQPVGLNLAVADWEKRVANLIPRLPYSFSRSHFLKKREQAFVDEDLLSICDGDIPLLGSCCARYSSMLEMVTSWNSAI